MSKKGIVLIACGHPNYGKMAFNLAFSIKQTETKMPIALIFAGESLSDLSSSHKKYFDYFIKVHKESYYYLDKIAWHKIKLYIYDFSPFDSTIYLDVDTIWFPNKSVSNLFNYLQHTKFIAQHTKKIDVSKKDEQIVWAKTEDICKDYKIDKGIIYDFNSSFLYFTKTEKNYQFFETAKEVFENLKLSRWRKWRNTIADELCISLASLLTNNECTMTPFEPLFLGRTNGVIKKDILLKKYWGLSLPGTYILKRFPHSIELYDEILLEYHKNYNFEKIFRYQDKCEFMK